MCTYMCSLQSWRGTMMIDLPFFLEKNSEIPEFFFIPHQYQNVLNFRHYLTWPWSNFPGAISRFIHPVLLSFKGWAYLRNYKNTRTFREINKSPGYYKKIPLYNFRCDLLSIVNATFYMYLKLKVLVYCCSSLENIKFWNKE